MAVGRGSMSDEAVFDGSVEPVMELVLSSDDEFTGADADSVEERRLQRDELRARFLPGVDAGALIALGVSLVSLVSTGLVEVLAQSRELSYQPNLGGGHAVDPMAPLREANHLRFLAQGVVAAVAVVVAVLVANNWRAERHARWSRPAAHAALVIGLVGVVIAGLGYFDVIGGLPKPHVSGNVIYVGN